MSSRIATLLPSATEIVCALGLGDRLVGVSHECDHPPEVRTLPRLTSSSIDSTASSGEIDRQVRAQLTRGLSLYQVDEQGLAALAPDLIITQDTCRVCAVSLPEVEAAVASLVGSAVQVVSLAPLALDDVLDGIEQVAEVAGVPERGARLVAELRGRLDRLRATVAGREVARVLALEWLDPPMPAGHWTPELIRAAGGDPILGHDRAPTRATTWTAIADAAPEVLLLLPCGFPVEQTRRELPALLARPEVAATPAVQAGRVAVIDGNAYFNRPGPRLIDSAELAASLLHPGAIELDLPAGSYFQG